MNITWQYISQSQKSSSKEQVRAILQKLQQVVPPTETSRRSHGVSDPDPADNRSYQELERDIIFGDDNRDPDLSFMHNGVSLSNCIVDHDRIVGLVNWEMAGFFGWNIAADVHIQNRTPRRTNFALLNLPEETLKDILFWNDLYDVE